MSIEIQKRIKDNATSVSDFFSDLYKWTEDQEKEERRRQIRKTAQQAGVNEAQKLLVAKPAESTPAVKVDDEVQDDRSDAIRRDRNPMAQYYNDWDQYDPDAEVDKIEDEAFQQQRAEREARQAEKDRILDEMALKPNGDRTRTTTARPRVKISVRRSGRRVAPVDLAAPRKDEANRLFGAGRYREAIAAYTAALDCLEKYEPPEAPGRAVRSTADGGRDQEDSCGQEQEAIALKVALLANRALACFKLEDWRECVVDASEALRFEPLHHKATLRRGFALARMKRWGPAAKDLDRAVSVDPADKKASAELQMVRRMLAEQAKEARAHAKCVMCDPTRDPTMPTRKLVVKVQRGEVDRAERVEAAEREEKDLRKPPEEAEAPPAPAESPAPRSRHSQVHDQAITNFMKKLDELRNLFIDDRNPKIMKFKEGMSVIWKTTREERPSLRKACSESFLFSGELLRLKDTNKTGRNKEEEQNDTSWILRRTVKVEHTGPVRPTRTELLPVKSCLRRDQQGSQSTPSPNCKRVTFSMYALILTAASQNSVSELQDLLDKKPWYINKPSSSGETALHKAAAKGSLDCVQLLVQRGANVNLVDKQGRTPLLIAWENRHLECHKYMLT